MTIASDAGHVGYRHELLVYGSDDELLEFIVPYVHEAIEAHHPAVVELPPRETTFVRAALKDNKAVTFLPALANRTPTSRIRNLRSLLSDLSGSGRDQVRVASTVPHPGLGAPWHPWSRYEAAINDLLADVPVWGVCLYDRRVTPDHVLGDIARTHPHIRTSDGRGLANPRYEDPRSFLQSMPPAPPDALEATPPAAELVDPSPAAARRAAEDAAQQAGLTHQETSDITIAVSEAVTNAFTHGRPPTTLQLWAAPGRVVVTVTDHGHGPQDPYAGLTTNTLPNGVPGGYGLWITHQLSTATHSRDDSLFTIRLIVGTPLP
jgi:anti-sigma regulatory factor (Ser/Thr protein kinase)